MNIRKNFYKLLQNQITANLGIQYQYDLMPKETPIHKFQAKDDRDEIEPKQEEMVKKATQNNLEPMAFGFSGGGFGAITSDQYSFLDMDSDSLSAKGNGGVRQMHNYVDLNYSDNISTPDDDHDYKGSNKISGDLTVEQLQQQREQDLQKLTGNKPPIKY